ncbi:hypothetical protein BD310DRAFT_837509, partial [Dichomitus squalens]
MSSPAAHVVPWEIIEHCVDSCSEDYSTLKQWALTCHALLPRTRTALFRHVRIRTRLSLSRFVGSISTKPELAMLVLQLSIIPACSDALYAPFMSFSRLFRRLRAMSLGVDPTLSTPPYAASFLRYDAVISVEIAKVAFRDHSDFVKLLWTFPHVRTLRLGAITFTNQPTPVETARLRDRSVRKDRIPSQLKTVEVQASGLFPLELMEALGFNLEQKSMRIVKTAGL